LKVGRPRLIWLKRRERFEEAESEERPPQVWWSEFLATDPEVPGSIPGAARFSERWWVWCWVHSASWG
jgi:hypothetical protein